MVLTLISLAACVAFAWYRFDRAIKLKALLQEAPYWFGNLSANDQKIWLHFMSVKGNGMIDVMLKRACKGDNVNTFYSAVQMMQDQAKGAGPSVRRNWGKAFYRALNQEALLN